jgi:hypothetical protein
MGDTPVVLKERSQCIPKIIQGIVAILVRMRTEVESLAIQ